jgi:hypothetical protein
MNCSDVLQESRNPLSAAVCHRAAATVQEGWAVSRRAHTADQTLARIRLGARSRAMGRDWMRIEGADFPVGLGA